MTYEVHDTNLILLVFLNFKKSRETCNEAIDPYLKKGYIFNLLNSI